MNGSAHHASGYADHGRIAGYRPDDHRTCPDLDVVSNMNVAEDFRSGPDHHLIPDGRMPFAALIPRAAERDALIQQNIVPDLGRFTDHHTHAMVDEKSLADLGGRVNLNSSQ